MTTRNTVRLGSTYRITVPWYDLSDGATLADLDAAPTLQAYQSDGTTTAGPAVTCTKSSTGIYYGDLTFSTGFSVGTYIWKMSGLSGTKARCKTGELAIVLVT